jgi:hypothetical protein
MLNRRGCRAGEVLGTGVVCQVADVEAASRACGAVAVIAVAVAMSCVGEILVAACAM